MEKHDQISLSSPGYRTERSFYLKFYWKIAAVLLTLFLLIASIYLISMAYTARSYMHEVNQDLYGGIASQTVEEVRPLMNGQVDTAAIQDIMHSMMVINRSVEVYLLDTSGGIITYVAPKKKIQLDRVALEPVLEFIQGNRERVILGDDPRKPGQRNVFSAAEIRENDQLAGYLYIVLASEEHQAVWERLTGSYILRLCAGVFLSALLAALTVGLVAFWYFTGSLRRIIYAVRKFDQGDYKQRISEKSAQEFTPLATAFNQMAATIEAYVGQLESVEKFRRELISNVSHDLRTPLAVVQGYIETILIKEGEASQEQIREYLHIVHRGTENLSKLVGQLFEYSKLEAQQVRPVLEAFSLRELAGDIIREYQLPAQQKQIELRFHSPEKLPLVYADISLVERVLRNLLDNALKFTQEQGVVELSLLEKGQAVEVKVSDNGPGIAEGDQSEIFQRYYRGENSPSVNSGVGLGLAIVKKILEIHQSTIQVFSRPNQGAAFWFQLSTYGRR